MISEVMPSYGRVDVAFERGDGAYLFTSDGQKFLDFASGIAVTSLGHNHPHLVAALTEQASKLWHCSNLFRIPEQERLAHRLVENSFADTVFFANSGVEAVEAGLKLVRKFHHDSGAPERYRTITFDGSFHGRTLSAISAGANAAHQTGFGPLMDAFDHVSFGNLNEVRNAITAETGSILVESVQGEGGIRPGDEAFLRGLRETCDEFGLLLFYDEVQTGMGRTGHLFGYEAAGVAPDVMSLAKALGGGFPIGACLATERAAVGIVPGTHGSTFGGNPLATAVANAVLDVMLEDGFMSNVRAMGDALMSEASGLQKKWPDIIELVRGAGLMIGLKSVVPNGDLVTACREAGLLTVPAAENIVRLLPPLIIDNSHVDEAIGMIDTACRALSE
ncbi:MAG: aspartate aminotransferase family protein [Rhodospirillaceae bacterium]|nr:aspartate aminotransferase family protein [Rhodospirillaceae bacterium]MBT5455211.1 aspartate aminotransferase family protein [Rhodospirillaceae bacterium]